MAVRLYIETNFIAGTIFGREVSADFLFALPAQRVQICLPEVCLMEVLSAFEDEQKRRNRLTNELDVQIKDVRRRGQLRNSAPLLTALQAAFLSNSEFLRDTATKLDEITALFLGQRANFAGVDLLPIRAAYAPDAFTLVGPPPQILDQPTDTLILRVVCADALLHSNETRVFVSGNTKDFGSDEVRRFLTLCGLRYFASTDAFLGWLDSGSPSDPAPVSA